ncbi:sodium:proton exchanger [Candidatus Pacearchaeota archaeon CG10_big_fil_rev_8_21_14_0_10_34_76]|nr:MAG: sodium:proton exchanger [Candidatus Pacearchaeota archaeon CG10_big_fil_rev_8_21_14_0_10_34_76]
MENIIFELGLIIGLATILVLIFKFVKQPPIIAYMITGILAGPLFFNFLHSTTLFESFSHIAVALLLFIVGLNLDFRIMKNFGKVSFVVGIGQLLITAGLGFFLGRYLGFSDISAIYISIALAFSSTFVVVKLISDKRELDTLHGKIALGILIVQDFIAALVLTVFPVLDIAGGLVYTQLAKVAFLVAVVFILSYFFVPAIFSFAAKNQEVLFLFGLSWALLISLLFNYLGFSLEVGALVAGMALASSKYSLMISSKTKGLRDFFVLLFFVFFGSYLVGPFDSRMIISAVAFSLLVLIGNPIIIMGLMKSFGYKKRTSFFTGISLAQISEFSLVFMLIGFTNGVISSSVFSLIILVALITIALSSYSLFYSHLLYRILSPALRIFDSKRSNNEHETIKEKSYDVILFGYNRIGFNLLSSLDKKRKRYLVVDYNPETIKLLSGKGVSCIYGDAQDSELLKELRLDEAKLVISTIPEVNVNLTILRNLNLRKTGFMPTAHFIGDAEKLYEAGANYVIMPHFLGGELASHLLLRTEFDKGKLSQEGRKHLAGLADRIAEGHRHPTSDYHGD